MPKPSTDGQKVRELVKDAAGPLDAAPRVYCFGCGYDLEAVSIGGHCPECGEPVNISVAHARATTRRQAVSIVLRLASILLIFLILIYS